MSELSDIAADFDSALADLRVEINTELDRTKYKTRDEWHEILGYNPWRELKKHIKAGTWGQILAVGDSGRLVLHYYKIADK
tara:strand:+ start:31484 stop:31726 length:243 start_codon:yes stop_codon:yes gene_type:complete